MSLRFRALLAALLLAACAPAPSATPDAGTTTETPDAGTTSETPDAGSTTETPDAGTAVTVPLPGFGSISGDCGVLDDELTSPQNYLVRNDIDFGTNPFDAADEDELSADGQRMYETPNAGGSSLLSEVFSLEILHRCELASLLKTETEIHYADPTSKITDTLVQIDGLRVGVSVTRAVGYPRDAPYTVDTAKSLLTKKLQGIQSSSASVAPEDKWVKQILHVLCYGPAHADAMTTAWNAIDSSLRGDTILMLSVSDGSDEFIYSNQ